MSRPLTELFAECERRAPTFRLTWILPEDMFDAKTKADAKEGGIVLGLAPGLEGSVRATAEHNGRPIVLELIVGLLGLTLEEANRAVLEGMVTRLGGEP